MRIMNEVASFTSPKLYTRQRSKAMGVITDEQKRIYYELIDALIDDSTDSNRHYANFFYELVNNKQVPKDEIHNYTELCMNYLEYNNSNDIFQYLIDLPDYMLYKSTKFQNLVVPENVKTIGKYCFASSVQLLTARLDDSQVTVINEGAFRDCQQLGSFISSNVLAKIKEEVFANDISLESVSNLPETVKISNSAFDKCVNLDAAAIYAATQRASSTPTAKDPTKVRTFKLNSVVATLNKNCQNVSVTTSHSKENFVISRFEANANIPAEIDTNNMTAREILRNVVMITDENENYVVKQFSLQQLVNKEISTSNKALNNFIANLLTK